MLFDAATLFLQLAKLLEGPFELAGEALAMEAEGGEGSGLFAKGFGDGECRVGLGVLGIDAVRVLCETQGEKVVLESGNTVEAPGSVGDGLHELFFDHASRLQVVEETLGEAL